MIIDFHTHIWPGEGKVETFLKGMDDNGVDVAVVCALASNRPGVKASNQFVYETVKQHPKRLLWFASVVPDEEGAPAELERCVRELGARGLKLHPPLQNFSCTDPAILPTIRKAAELDIPILIHTGGVFSQMSHVRLGDPADVDDLAMMVPGAKIVMAHGNPLGVDPIVAAKHPNVYMDTASRFTSVQTMIPKAGAEMLNYMRRDDRLVYGSDANPNRTWRFAPNIAAVRSMDVSEETKAKVLSGTAMTLLKLEGARS